MLMFNTGKINLEEMLFVNHLGPILDKTGFQMSDFAASARFTEK